jgi:hypothetical protein
VKKPKDRLRLKLKGDLMGVSQDNRFEIMHIDEDGTESVTDLTNFVMEFEYPRTKVGSLSVGKLTLLLNEVEIESKIGEIIGIEYKPRRLERLRRIWNVTTVGSHAKRWVES